MNSMCDSSAVETSIPNHPGAWFSSSGSTTMKAAPKKLPSSEPMPPMMIMNSRLKLTLMLNASGSQAPR